MKTKLIAGMVVLALVVTATSVVLARDIFGTQPPVGMQPLKMAHQWSRGPWCMNQLTDEEREEVKQQLQNYRQDLLEQYGITLTGKEQEAIREQLQEKRDEMQQEMLEFRLELFELYDMPLTAEGRQEIREQLQEKRDEMQQEMLEFRLELFEQYGIDLTDKEWEGIHQQLREFRLELFEQYDISCPCSPREGLGPQMHGYRHGSGFRWFAQTSTQEE